MSTQILTDCVWLLWYGDVADADDDFRALIEINRSHAGSLSLFHVRK